jgi:hypothetical protein
MAWSTGNFVFNFFSVTIYQEVPKLIRQKEFVAQCSVVARFLWRLGPVITELLNYKKSHLLNFLTCL